MADDYTGDANGTQAPGPQCGALAIPIATIPEDGDPLAAASVRQAHKEAMDYIAFLNTVARYSRRMDNPDSDNPAVEWIDGDGVAHYAIDHMGYPAGRISHITDSWGYYDAGGFANGVTFGPWLAAHAANMYMQSKGAGETDGGYLKGACLRIYPSGSPSVGEDAILSTGVEVIKPHSTIEAVIEFEMLINTIGANKVDVLVGLSANLDATPAGADHICAVGKRASDTNWQLFTADGATLTATNSTIPPVANTRQRFRLELWGSSTYKGAMARLFVEDGSTLELAAEVTTTLPTAAMYLAIAIKTTALSAATVLSIGPITAYWNRY